ncbi:MAG: hypothetical protein IPJ79_13810 [Bacteroidetes bacterium]|nr:hypothetical protein [Bacteroidota bacterium]
MNVKHLKPQNLIVLIVSILMHINAIALLAQEEPPRNNGADYEPPPVVNNMAQCGANGTNYNCPKVLQGLTKPAPPVPNEYTVTNAQELYELLSCFYQDWQINGYPLNPDPNRCFTTLTQPISCSGIIPTCSTKITIRIAPGTDIDFRTGFTPDIFPIEVVPGIEIIGTFDLGNVTNGLSEAPAFTSLTFTKQVLKTRCPANTFTNSMPVVITTLHLCLN